MLSLNSQMFLFVFILSASAVLGRVPQPCSLLHLAGYHLDHLAVHDALRPGPLASLGLGHVLHVIITAGLGGRLAGVGGVVF
jgi:hypothetical protein